jgi:hypothetical protein
MVDLSQLSDAELQAMYSQPAQPTRVTVRPEGAVDLSQMSDADLKAAYGMTLGESAADIGKSAAVGLGKGLISLAGLPGDIAELGARGIDRASQYVGNALGVDVAPRQDRTPTYGSGDIQKGIEQVTGSFYAPKSTAGEYAQTAGEFLPGLIGGPETLATKLMTRVAAPAITSETAGQLTKGGSAEPYARVIGALLGGMTPSAVGRAITPAPATESRQRLVDILANEGVTSLTAGQRSGNKSLQYAESILGDGPFAGGGTSRIQQEGQRQFTEAAMRRAGAGPDATPEVLFNNQERLSQNFRDLSSRNNLNPDNQFITDITNAVRNYRRVPDSQQRQMVQGYVDDIIDHVNAGNMPGPQYQEMRSRLSRQSNSLRQSDPTLSEALRDMRNALDNAMDRSIPAGSNDAALWRQNRREYSAQKTIEKAASRAGEATAEGQLVPANLRNAVATENRGAYARGQGDFSELSRAGSSVMAPLPNSGTAQRNLLTDIAKMLVTAPAGRAITSRPVQAYLGNQVMARALENLSPRDAAVLNALMATQQQRLEFGR